MRFLMMVKSDERAEAGVLPDEKVLSAMGEYNEQLIKSGIMLAGDGLQASSKGTRVQIAGGKTRVIDGPFTEAKELVAGYWLVQAKSKQEVIEWTKRVPFDEGEVELRELYEPEDFPIDRGSSGTVVARKRGTKRFMILIKSDKNTEAGRLATEALLDRMGALLSEMTSAGVLLSGDGLKPSTKGAKVRFAGEKRSVIDGPFSETKELIAGFSIVQVNSKQEAVAWARRMLEIHVEETDVGEGVVEVRELFELDDFQ